MKKEQQKPEIIYLDETQQFFLSLDGKKLAGKKAICDALRIEPEAFRYAVQEMTDSEYVGEIVKDMRSDALYFEEENEADIVLSELLMVAGLIRSYNLPCYWQQFAYIKCKAESFDEAVDCLVTDTALPDESEFVSDSFEVDIEQANSHKARFKCTNCDNELVSMSYHPVVYCRKCGRPMLASKSADLFEEVY